MRTILACILFVCSTGCGIRAEDTPPPEAFRVMKHIPMPGKRITPYLNHQVDTAWRQDDLRKSLFASIRSETELLQLQRDLRGKLLDMMGGLPEIKTPLNPQITGTIQLDGYRIEKVIFESMPDFHVTALVYVPDGPVQKRPAVLVACGHSAIAKSYPMYQKICSRLAMRGYVVLCWDPIGQGERSQFWDRKLAKSRYNLICGEHSVLGNLAYLAGVNIIRWMIWDGIRAFDYLSTREDVDSSRISITGTSGGGTQSSHIGALDTRIGMVAPSCYICAYPMRMNTRIYVDPDSDPEQDLYRMISSGVDYPGLLLSVYPRPLIVCAGIEDRSFPIEGTRKTFREIADIYRRFGFPERIAFSEGYHGHQYSDVNQEEVFTFMDRFNTMPVRHGLDSTQVITEEVLRCTRTGQVSEDFEDEQSLIEIIRQCYRVRKNHMTMNLVDLYYGDFYPGIITWQVVAWEGKAPRAEIAYESTGSAEFDDVVIDRYLLHHTTMLSIPLLHFYRKNMSSQRVLLWLSSRGKASTSDWQEIKNYLYDGYQVISFDFRGTGENQLLYQASYNEIDHASLTKEELNRHYWNPLLGVMANYVYNSLLIGRPYYLQMIEDAEIAARFIQAKLKAEGIWVTAHGETYTLAYDIAGTLSGVQLMKQDEKIIKWSEIVENNCEIWPIQYLLPGGAYIR